MSMKGVIDRTVNALIANRGRMTEASWNEISAYADQFGLTDGEKRSLLDPQFLKNNAKLKAAGIEYDKIVYEPSVQSKAAALAQRLGMPLNIPGAGGSQPPPPPPATDLARAKAALAEALGKGKNLGTFEDWKLQTSGADVSFAVTWGGKKYPALVLTLPDFKDPAPRDLVKDNAAAIKGLNSVDGLKGFLDQLLAKEKNYFTAEGVQVKSQNERFGIEQKRRDTFFADLAPALAGSAIPAADRAKTGHVLLRAQEGLMMNRDYNMEVGSHTNYWPYWNNYASFLVKVLEQTEKNSEEYLTISNRLRDIYTRKTVFSWNREVVERDFEASIGGALIYNPMYSRTAGHRVSLAEGSNEFEPVYELLSVRKDNLPAALSKYAGMQVYRDGNQLKFDFMGEGSEDRAGKAIPAELAQHITAQKLNDDQLAGITIRKLVGAETARAGISADWDGNKEINVAKILIGWWGHCHNESPLNAMGIDPLKGIELYRADRKVKPEKALQKYDENDAWNVAGAFASDHEGQAEYANNVGALNVDKTAFVGDRNNGGHWFRISFNDGGQARTFDAEVTRLWHRAQPGQQPEEYPDPMSRFRRDIENPDGTFSPNPEWVNSGARQEDEIILDAMNRKMELKLKYITLDQRGSPTEREESVTLDPSKDGYVKLGEELTDRYPGGGGKITEHRFNPKSKEYDPVIFEIKQVNGQWERKELMHGTKRVAAKVESQQETTFDSVEAIHNFVTARMGLPFVFDTSSGMAVWNYPVNFARVDRTREVEKVEDGKKYIYTSYKLTYTTMGGPSGESEYIIKRDEAGKTVRSTATTPMPDFAFRNEKWVCAPVAEDDRGSKGYNYQAYFAGYLLAEDGKTIVPELWKRQAELLFASISDQTAKDNAYCFINDKGQMVSFGTKAEFDLAVKADLDVRRMEA